MKKLMTVLAVVLTAAGVRAASYELNPQAETFGDGSEVAFGSEGFPYDGMTFDFGSGALLRFTNRMNLNATDLTINIPTGKEVYWVGGLTNNVAYAKSGENTAHGSITRTKDSGDKGTLIVSNGVRNVRWHLRDGKTIVENCGCDSLFYYYYQDASATMTINGGKLDSSGEFAVSGGTVTLNDVAFNKQGNATYNGAWNVTNGRMVLTNTTVTTGGNSVLTVGGVYSSDKAHNGRIDITGDKSSLELCIQSGFKIGNYGTGTLNLNAGKFYIPYGEGKSQVVGNAATGTGVMNIAGGEFQLQGYAYSAGDDKVKFVVGSSGTGTVNVASGGKVTIARAGDAPTSYNGRAKIVLGQNAGAEGTFNLLEGGTLTLRQHGVLGGAGTSRFRMNGGKVIYERADSGTTRNIVKDVTECSMGPKGGEVNINTTSLGLFPQPITAYLSDEPVTGEFKKTGAYSLTLTGENTYLVPTHVVGGSLLFAEGATIPNSTLSVDAGATVDFTGSGKTIGGVGTLAGTLTDATDLTFAGETQPGGAGVVGTTTLNCSSLTFAEGAKLVIDCDDTSCDKFVVNTASGAVDLSNLTVEVKNWEGKSRIGPIMEATNGLTGLPTVSADCKLKIAYVEHGKLYLAKPGLLLMVR